MPTHHDFLPTHQRHIPASKAEALLVFGTIGSEELPLYQEPTDTIPGSKARVEVYRLRASRNEPIFNPLDVNGFEGLGIKVPATGTLLESINATLLKEKYL
jgi:hypothetical protein